MFPASAFSTDLLVQCVGCYTNVMKISLIAIKPLTYAGQEYAAGDYFEASPVWAAALRYQKKAKLFSQPDPRWQHVSGLGELIPVVVESPRPKRRYRRRDMKAEE